MPCKEGMPHNPFDTPDLLAQVEPGHTQLGSGASHMERFGDRQEQSKMTHFYLSIYYSKHIGMPSLHIGHTRCRQLILYES